MRSVNGDHPARIVSKIQQTETVFSPDNAFALRTVDRGI
jgi:hypothetical protein